MAVQHYSSEDAGAPQFTVTRNVSGNYQNSIIEVLDAILVTGYGDKSACGWTKEMTSEVPDSNRTVYKNKSACQDDMFLLVESNRTNALGIKMQIADVVTSPETYSGYSQVAAGTQVHTGAQYWQAVGDERTLIVMFYSWYVDQHSTGGYYIPHSFYIGDFDLQGNINPKGWGLLSSYMAQGTLDTVTNGGETRGALSIDLINYSGAKVIRPVTQAPGEPWSENDVYCYLTAFEARPTSTASELVYADISDFEANAAIRSPWFFILNLTHIYRLRGVHSFFPWLRTSSSSNKRNFAKPLMVEGIGYLPLPQTNNPSSASPMTVYIQTSGDW